VQLAAAAELDGHRYWPTANASGSASSRTSCVTPRPCASGARAVALLLRGEIYRWGCDAFGVAKQREVAAAYNSMLLTPLEQAGHCVHVVLALDRGCGRERDADLIAMYGDRVALATRIATKRQPSNTRAALDLVTTDAAVRDRYDFVVFARHDVRLLRPLSRWACNLARAAPSADVLSVGSQCAPREWRAFNCSSDLMYVVPRALLTPFSQQVGRVTSRSKEHCCFHPWCLGQGGHGCLNLLTPAIMRAADADVASFAASGRLDFCWPRMQTKVSEWNLHYQVPQCTDLPGAKPGSVWRCRLPTLSHGREYTPEGDDDLTAHEGRKRRKRKPVG